MSKLKAYRKLIVAVIGLAVTLGLLDTETGQYIGGALTAIGVFLFPNDQ